MANPQTTAFRKGTLVMKKSNTLQSGIEVFLVLNHVRGFSGIGDDGVLQDIVEVVSSLNNEVHLINERELQHYYPIMYNLN